MLQDTHPVELAEPPAGRSDAAGTASLERLAIDLLDHGEDLSLPEPGTGPAPPFDPGLRTAAPGEADLVLRLDDMLADGNDEVVLLTDSGQGRLALAADADVVARGTAGDHLTADGQDVSGFAFVTFATGMTLFYPDDMDLAVLPNG